MMFYMKKDVLEVLKSPLRIFYEASVDNGELLSVAANEIENLRKWQERVIKLYPNIGTDYNN